MTDPYLNCFLFNLFLELYDCFINLFMFTLKVVTTATNKP